MKSNFLNNLNKVFFKKKYSIFSFAFDFLGKKKTIFVILILAFLGIVGSLVSTIIPLFLQNIIEELEKILNQNIVEKELFSKFVFSAMMIIIIYLVKFLFCDVPNTIFTSIFDQQITFSLRKRMFEKIPKIPFSYYEKTSQGHIITLLVHDTQNISNTFLGGISGIFSSIIIFFGTTISMLIINWKMGILCLITAPIIFLIVRIITKKTKKITENKWKDLDNVNQNISEMFLNTLLIRMNNKEKEAQEEFEKLSYRLHKSTKKVSFITSLQNAFINVNYYINVTIICLYSVIVTFLSSSNENSPIFSIPSFLILIQLAQIPYTNFSTSIIGLTSTLTSLERCNVFLKNEEVLEENEKEIQKIESIEKIEFKNVSFGYTEQNNNIINNFNLKISKNQKIGIIGETGSGKTTILNLLMRFYECGDGKILINGMDIKNIKISQVRSLFSIINQEPWFFYGTIRENIVYNTQNISEEDLINACKKAKIYDYICSLPQGFETIVNSIMSISIGQKQLLAIARLLIHKSKVIILDEATSNIDVETERKIQESLQEVMEGKISIIIAHRLSTIKKCDKIIVIKNGSIKESGTHEELLEKNGDYTELYKKQFE